MSGWPSLRWTGTLKILRNAQQAKLFQPEASFSTWGKIFKIAECLCSKLSSCNYRSNVPHTYSGRFHSYGNCVCWTEAPSESRFQKPNRLEMFFSVRAHFSFINNLASSASSRKSLRLSLFFVVKWGCLPGGQVRAGHLRDASFVCLSLGVFQKKKDPHYAVWQPQVLVWLAIFWLLSVTDISNKNKSFRLLPAGYILPIMWDVPAAHPHLVWLLVLVRVVGSRFCRGHAQAHGALRPSQCDVSIIERVVLNWREIITGVFKLWGQGIWKRLKRETKECPNMHLHVLDSWKVGSSQ